MRSDDRLIVVDLEVRHNFVKILLFSQPLYLFLLLLLALGSTLNSLLISLTKIFSGLFISSFMDHS